MTHDIIMVHTVEHGVMIVLPDILVNTKFHLGVHTYPYVGKLFQFRAVLQSDEYNLVVDINVLVWVGQASHFEVSAFVFCYGYVHNIVDILLLLLVRYIGAPIDKHWLPQKPILL